MLFQKYRLLAMHGNLGFKVGSPENEIGEFVGYRSHVSLPQRTQ